MKRIELLAPAGSFSVMKACIQAGADAIYMGLPKFSARAYAENAESASYLDAIRYAHLRNVRLYCTVNTLFKERELEDELEETIRPLYEAGLDAVIVQDLGVMKRISERFPLLPIHVSTQATVTGYRTAEFLKRYHVTRIVPARELSFAEVRELREKSGLEVECFVHGALCYCYSGQCLFSSLAAQRSGNRGRCGQPCRLPYELLDSGGNPLSDPEAPYLLSMKDLNTLKLLPKLIEAGVTSFKIEGRMKKAEYAAGVTRIYRNYLDLLELHPELPYRVSKEDERHLFYLFNRQGFTTGYYERKNGRDMIALREKEFRKEESAYLEDIRASCILKEKRVPIRGEFAFRRNEPIALKLEAGIGSRTFSWTKTGSSSEVPEPARTRALTEEELKRQLSKTGGTDFEFESLTVDADEDLFLPIGRLNEFRRNALNGFSEALEESFKRP